MVERDSSTICTWLGIREHCIKYLRCMPPPTILLHETCTMQYLISSETFLRWIVEFCTRYYQDVYEFTCTSLSSEKRRRKREPRKPTEHLTEATQEVLLSPESSRQRRKGSHFPNPRDRINDPGDQYHVTLEITNISPKRFQLDLELVFHVFVSALA